MKKLVVTACVFALILLSSCSDSGYEEAFDAALADISAMSEAVDSVADYNLNAWNILGPNDVTYFLNMSSSAKSNADVGEGLAWKVDYPLMDKVFNTNVAHAAGMTAQQTEINEKVIPHFLAYQESLATAREKDELLAETIKEMKDNYDKKHGDAIEALSKYYLDTSSYLAYVNDLEGKNYVSYESEIGSYKTSITESKKAAELAK